MKHSIKKLLALLLSAVMLTATFAALPVTAGAVGSPKDMESTAVRFYADPENRLTAADLTAFNSGDKTAMVGAVGVYARSSGEEQYYLFLPSNADCTNLKVWFYASNCTVNGTSLTSGEATSVFQSCNAGGAMYRYTLVLDDKTYSLNVMKSGDVGTVYIDTDSGSIATVTNSSKHTTSEAGTIMVVNADGTLEYDGALEKFNGRGNGTWSTGNVKNPYNIKLASSTKLLGMPKAKKWCLLANSGDGTLVKNQLTYDFADYIGIRYQTHCKPVDLYVNQQYYGSYNLAEKAEIKSNRVNVTDNYENLEIANGTVDETTGTVTPADMDSLGLTTRTIDAGNNTVSSQTEASSNYYGHAVGARRYSAYASVSQSGVNYSNINDPSDLTGGYLFELEISQRWAEENAGFCAYNRQGWTVKSNDYISRHQVDYCYQLLYALGSSLYNGGVVPSGETTTTCNSLGNTSGLLTNYGAKSITNPAPAAQYQGKKWSDLLDADSAVRYYWTQEFFKNMDASTSSTYFYKDVDSKDSKLYAGPLWDMDNAIGYGKNSSRWGYSWTSTDGWYAKNTRIYRWRTRDSTTTYSSDSYAPLSFYGALATNCADFWQLAKAEWFTNVSPAVDILTSPESDDNTVLHSVDYYVDTVAKSAAMNFSRVSESGSYDTDAIKSDLKAWFGDRQTWIDSQFEKTSLNDCSIDVIPDQPFTGTAAEPAVTVTCNGAVLTQGRDYTVSYSSNTNVGTAFVSVTGIGLYTGTKTSSFRIVRGTLSGKASIPEAAYSGDVLQAVVTDDAGGEITDYIIYQWYVNGTAVSGATESSYTVTDSDKNKTITVTVTGDGTRFAGELESGECTVRTGVKPESYSETVATWFYDYQLNADALDNVASDGRSVYATDGRQEGIATLTASVDAVNPAKLSWSDPLSDIYYNATTSNTYDASPVMSASTSRTWGEYPYYDVTVDTRDYENITFSAKLGGTKKGPAVWQLQYSTDGVNYTDIVGAAFVISDNKKMQDAFTDVALPDACSNAREVHIRAVVIADRTIKNNLAIIGSSSGDSSINNVTVKGNRISAISSLDAPEIVSRSDNGDGTALFDTDLISLRDRNGGADVYYNIGGDDVLYTEPFSPFGENAKIGDTVTVTAYAKFDDIVSKTATATYTFAGSDISHFSYDTYTENVYAGTLFSNGGIYDGSARMTAYTDGSSQYVPCWDDSHGAFVIAPDDGARWSANSGFTFALCTTGYEDIRLTAKAYTTAQGPNSLLLQYSYDGGTWYAASQNMPLAANGELEQYLMTYELPDGCDNRDKVYVRLVAAENATHGSSTVASATLHNNASKGNLYINDIYFSGEENDEVKMPYTNKTSDYFGDTGSIKYYSPDGKTMHYSVVDSARQIILSGTYDAESGITVQNAPDFNRYNTGGYTVSVWAGDNDDRSAVNTRTYYYKGETICEFDYNTSDDPLKARPVADYLSADGTVLTNTDGTQSGTLAMTPNGSNFTTLSADGKYGVKASWASDNIFTYDNSTALDTPGGNGYWLITTGTLGYRGITLNMEQLSSNKGPRDWGLAYSTDGVNYTYVANSNVCAISNDAATSTVETYNNFALPQNCDNQETLYLKVFINGGESIDGNELADMLKGNTGANKITISGVPQAPTVTVNVHTVLLESDGDESGTLPVDATVRIAGTDYQTQNGTLTLNAESGEIFTLQASVNGTFTRTVQFTAASDSTVTVPLVAVDTNGDGYVNGRDWATITAMTDATQKAKYKAAFASFVGAESDTFRYE